MVQQPVEGVYGQARHHAFAQGLYVVAVGLALDGRAFAKPAARRQAGKGHGAAVGVVVAHLEQALDHAEPVGDGAPDAAHIVAGQRVAHQQHLFGAGALVRLQQGQPGNVRQFIGRGFAAAVVQGQIGAHAVQVKRKAAGAECDAECGNTTIPNVVARTK